MFQFQSFQRMIRSGGENYRSEAVRRKLRIQETQQEMLLNCSYVHTALRLIIIWVSLSHNTTKLRTGFVYLLALTLCEQYNFLIRFPAPLLFTIGSAKPASKFPMRHFPTYSHTNHKIIVCIVASLTS